MKRFYYTAIAILLSLTGCNSSENRSDTAKAQFIRLDDVIANFSGFTPEKQIATVDSLTLPLNDYIYLMGASTGNIPASIDSLSHTAAFAMFKPEVDKAFISTERIETELGTLNSNLRKSLPSLPNYSYYGIISPYRQQVMLVDSTIYVALNHYLGAKHEAYSSMPEFTRATKQSMYIPLDIAEAIITVEFPFIAEPAPTVIQYLIYEGAKLKAVSTLTGNTDISTLMGWSEEHTSSVQSQEGKIWKKMATDNIIYSTDLSLARHLCEPAPNSRAISPDLPGRVGRYIGYRIVDSYLEKNPGTTLSEILSPNFYNNTSTLIKSSYSPK